MKIYCKDCNKFLGIVISGSQLHKDIVFLCDKCYDAYKVLKSLKDYEKGTGKIEMPDFLNDLLKGAKK